MSSLLTPGSSVRNQSEVTERMEVLGQPCYVSRLRYRSDFNKGKNRRAFLRSQNNPNYQCPTIRIPQAYLQFHHDYYIRVSLVTVSSEHTDWRYIHPYDLEDANNDEYNDRSNNTVWFPIEAGDKDGIKSFPNLRIVKKTENELKKYGDLHVFDSPNALSISQLTTPKDTIREFNLDRLQLAFTLGQRKVINRIETNIAFAATTVFSNEVIEVVNSRIHRPKSSISKIYKYIPRKGFADGGDEVVIIFTEKLKSKRFGNFEILFEYDAPPYHWSEVAPGPEVKDQFIIFHTPPFPFPINTPATVNIILKEKKKSFATLQFQYIPKDTYSRDQQTANIFMEINLNRESISNVYSEGMNQSEAPSETNSESNTLFSPDTFIPGK